MVTTLAEACSYYENNQPRGEYVLVIAGKDRNELKRGSTGTVAYYV